MPTDVRNLNMDVTDDATWRAFGKGVSDSIAAAGLTRASDTGQINWATASKPTGAFTSGGYEVWRFSDSLQASKPIFILIDYHTSLNATSPGLGFTVATATNGAGVLSGQSVTFGTNRFGGASAVTCRCSASSDRLALIVGSFVALIERTRTAAGVPTGDGWVTYSYDPNAGTPTRFQVVPYSGGIPAAASANAALSLAPGVSAVGPYVALSPTIAAIGKILYASWAVYKDADLGSLIPIQADHLGAIRTMLPMSTSLVGSVNQSVASGHAMAIMWE